VSTSLSPTAVFLMAAAVPVVLSVTTMLVMHLGTVNTRRGGGTGAGWLDAESAFDVARWRHVRWRTAMLVTGRRRRVDLPVLEPGALRGMRPAGTANVRLERITGSVDGGRHVFDRRFDPSTDDAWPRFASVMQARLAAVSLPPVRLVERDGDYFVLDGHHRVAVARALGDDTIEAEVTTVASSGVRASGGR
jgi:hypothetical protein